MNQEAAKKLEVIKRVLKLASEDVRPPAPMWHCDFLEVAVKRIEEVQALSALPEKPMTELEINWVITRTLSSNIFNTPMDAARCVINALKAANVLYVAD